MKHTRLMFIAAFVLFMIPMLVGAADSNPIVQDIGLITKFQDAYTGELQRGRALIAADFNLDGRVDFYVGNPGQRSYILLNIADGNGRFHFRQEQILLEGDLAWGAVAFDYDNDGDYDLFVSCGGNEGVCLDYLFRNNWVESGQTELSFDDVTKSAGVAGPVAAGATEPLAVASAGVVAADYDQDADVDLFVSVLKHDNSPPELLGRDILWQNNGDGTFTDATDEARLGLVWKPTQHSAFLDIDNDGDMDLFQNNYDSRRWSEEGHNVLWRNQLVESGTATFEDVTLLFSPPGEDLRFPRQSFAATPADFNNDGWQDVLLVMRGEGPEPNSPYGDGHALFLNQSGTAFVNIANSVALNNPYQPRQGVMGCQVGDVSGDGVPDVYIGNGSMAEDGGQYDQYFASVTGPGGRFRFLNKTSLIDFPAPEHEGIEYPPYPYRTHGTAFVDVDGDGLPEIAVANGGPAATPDYAREPDRLFKFEYPEPRSYLQVRPVGDGITVSKDAIGTRLAATVRHNSGQPWTVYATLLAGSCFSAQNGFEVFLGLGVATTIESLTVTWPDGTVEVITDGLTLDTRMVVQK